ncbi:lipoate--protein ligase [Chloroflexota bacterium]|nr:lipoate--protein ligase [Chloroflexota bacterium]
MIYIETNSTDPTWNLAFEEYCLRELVQFERILLLWQNDNAIIIGRYQNAESEINLEAARTLDTKIVRRPSGGGAVYHDMGNLNYTFIYPIDGLNRQDISVYAEPMVKALNRIGVPAEIKGRNDLLLDGKKISGTAQRIQKGRLMHHGTLLYDSNLDSLEGVLQVDKAKVASKGIASIRSRVTNIKEYLPEGQFEDVQAFWRALLDAFSEEEPLTPFELTDEMLAEVEKLQKEKYQSWEWNFGNAPAFEYKNSQRYPFGKLEIQANIKKGLIEECKISGDFMGMADLDPLEEALMGVRYAPEDVRKVLDDLELSLYLGGITTDEFIQCLFEGTGVS